MNVQIGLRLREERERIGMTQEQMAIAGAVAKRTYCHYEAGEREIGSACMAALAAAGADVLYILTGQRGAVSLAPALAPDEAALLDNYRNSPPAGRDALKATSAALAQSCSTTKRRAG